MKKILCLIFFVCTGVYSQGIIKTYGSSALKIRGRIVYGVSVSATILATDDTATEASTTTGTFTVTLSSPSIGTTTINYSVGGTATSGSDFNTLSGSVDITDGNTTGTITVIPIDDFVNESDETVVVTLATGSGYTIGSPSSATVRLHPMMFLELRPQR